MNIDRRMAEMQQLRDEVNAVHQQWIRDKGNGGSGGNGSQNLSDDWKTSVNTQLERLHGDVRNLLYGWVGAVVFLLGAFAVGFVKLSDQSAALQAEQAKQGVRLDGMDRRFDGIDKKLDEISAKLDRKGK